MGEFDISGLHEAKAGEPQIEVTFSLDANGILEVTAKDLHTQSMANIKITSGGLSAEEIQRMLKDAQDNKEHDEQEVKKTEMRLRCEQMAGRLESNTRMRKHTEMGSEVNEWLMINPEASIEELEAKVKQMSLLK